MKSYTVLMTYSLKVAPGRRICAERFEAKDDQEAIDIATAIYLKKLSKFREVKGIEWEDARTIPDKPFVTCDTVEVLDPEDPKWVTEAAPRKVPFADGKGYMLGGYLYNNDGTPYSGETSTGN